MIGAIGYTNFKCFEATTSIPFSKLNLLTGSNGRGKSTTLQGLLLMRQSIDHSRTTENLLFNGGCVELGTIDDVKNVNSSRSDPIFLEFHFIEGSAEIQVKYKLREDHNDDMVGVISGVNFLADISGKSQRFAVEFGKRLRIRHGKKRFEVGWRDLFIEPTSATERFLPDEVFGAVNFRRIHYISADRLGPRDYYAKQSFTEFPNVGRNGEYTANVLTKKGDDDVAKSLRLPTAATSKVIDQLEAWLSHIFDGGSIRVRSTSANIVIVSMNSENSTESTRTFRPTNVGFGYSYALPIIVSGLIAKPGEIVIVENPEAHLHPYAQSQLARFLAKVAMSGVQVFIESHSDHVLNSLRIVVKESLINPEDINLLYFHRDENVNLTKVEIGKDGSIAFWPQGFFDQSNHDFERLFT